MAIERIGGKEKRNGDPMKIYLETTIVIGGGKLPGSDRLKELSKKGKVKLFISGYVSMEVYQGLTEVFRQKNEFLNTHKEHNKDFFAKMNEIRKKQHEREVGLEKELNYWKKDCKINYCKSICGNLIGTPLPFLLAFVTKFYEHIHLELSRLEQLETKYNIKDLDAVHLMEAQCSKMNWFLTEDKDFLKKRASGIPWLTFKISRLEKFLRIHNWF